MRLEPERRACGRRIRLEQTSPDTAAAPFRQQAHAERSAVRPRRKGLATNVARADHLVAGKGERHRVPIFEVALDKMQRVRFGRGFEHRQISALARNDIEGASITLDVIERHWLDPYGRLVQLNPAFSILSSVNSFTAASALRSTMRASWRETVQLSTVE